MTSSGTELKSRILAEMTVQYGSSLEKNFDLAKQFVKITSEGSIDVLVKDRVSGPERILLYLIGKLYAKESGLANTIEVGNEELMKELGIPEGSLNPWLTELRATNKVKTTRRDGKASHTVSASVVEPTLLEVQRKIQGK